jgi:chromate reductase, NAD(P)H dehydrogenase (quinone)
MTLPDNIHVLAFAGSLRQESYNKKLLRAAHDLLPDSMSMECFDLAPLPFYNADVEAQETPASVMAFRQHMRAADALLIATPEYNYSISAVLKNAVDWASRAIPDPSPLDDKPVAIMGAGGGGGTIRAQTHLRDILIHNRNYVVVSPQIMLARAHQYFDRQGHLHDDAIRARITRLLDALADLTRKLKS